MMKKSFFTLGVSGLFLISLALMAYGTYIMIHGNEIVRSNERSKELNCGLVGIVLVVLGAVISSLAKSNWCYEYQK